MLLYVNRSVILWLKDLTKPLKCAILGMTLGNNTQGLRNIDIDELMSEMVNTL